MPDLSFLRAEIERMRYQLQRQRKEIRALQKACISTKPAEELLDRMQAKIDGLCAERDRQRDEQCIKYPGTDKPIRGVAERRYRWAYTAASCGARTARIRTGSRSRRRCIGEISARCGRATSAACRSSRHGHVAFREGCCFQVFMFSEKEHAKILRAGVRQRASTRPKRERARWAQWKKETNEQITSLQDRLSEFANGERAKAEGMPDSAERYEHLKKIRQAECAANIEAWVNSPGLQPPK